MAGVGQGGDRYTDPYTDRCTALYCGYRLQFMLMQFHQGWLHVSLVAEVRQL